MLFVQNRARLEKALVDYVAEVCEGDLQGKNFSLGVMTKALEVLLELERSPNQPLEPETAEEREERGTEIDDALNAVYTGLMGLKRALED